MFAQLVNGGGFTADILLFSPSRQPAAGVLRLYSQRGDVLSLIRPPLKMENLNQLSLALESRLTLLL